MSRLENITDEEWQVRCDLAACYRLFVKFGWTDLIFTHLCAGDNRPIFDQSLRPVVDEHSVQPDYGWISTKTLSGDYPYNQAGHAIHTAVLSARPEVNVALHSHTRAGAAVSAMGEGLLPLSQHAMKILGLTCYHPYAYAPDSEEECRRLARDLDDKWLMIMHNHGLLAAGRTVAEAFYYLYILEAACKIQVDVLSASSKPILPDQDAIESPPNTPLYLMKVRMSM